MKFKFNPRTLKTTIRLKPDFRFKENKSHTLLKAFYGLNKKMGVITI